MRRMLCLLAGLLCLASAVWAENLRQFPAETKRAVFNGFVDNGMKLGRYTLALAPGLQIRDRDNLIILPARLSDAKDVQVRVQFDTTGAVWRMWILTPEEAAVKN